jgi:hypothetical protein
MGNVLMALCFVSYRKKLTGCILYAQAQSDGLSEQRAEEPTAIYEGGNN